MCAQTIAVAGGGRRDRGDGENAGRGRDGLADRGDRNAVDGYARQPVGGGDGDGARGALAIAGGRRTGRLAAARGKRSEEHTSELQSLMRISYAVFCLKKTKSMTKNIGSRAQSRLTEFFT